METLVALFLVGLAFAATPFRTHASFESSANVDLYSLSGYFQRLHAAAKPDSGDMGVSDGVPSHGSGTGLASLPAAAIGPVLKFDSSFFLRGADPENEFAAALEAELAAQATHTVADTTFSYVLCGPQATASAARDALTAETNETYHTVAYTSPIDDTACWNAQLTLSQYRAFVSAMNLKLSPFFAAAPVPTMAKFGPSLLARAPGTVETKNLGSSFGEAADEAGAFTNFSVSARAILDMDTSSGIYIVLHDGVETLREVSKWTRDAFGLKGDHAQTFFPLAVDEETDADVDSVRAHPVWARVRRAAATGRCPSLLDIKVPSDGLTGANLRAVLEKKKTQAHGAAEGTVEAVGTSDATAIHHDHCALLALAYLAAQPEVRIIDILPHQVAKQGGRQARRPAE